ncbi:MAG TPA: NHLP leader peptide family RiPP precursor [Stenomitos sp.]
MQLTDVIAKALREPEFRNRLLTHPQTVLRELSVEIPATQNVSVLESRAGEVLFVLPMLTDAEAQQMRDSLGNVHPQRSMRSRIVLRAREDPSFKAQLQANPKAVLQAEGLPIPDTTTVSLLENSPEQLYLVLPQVHLHTRAHAHSH